MWNMTAISDGSNGTTLKDVSFANDREQQLNDVEYIIEADYREKSDIAFEHADHQREYQNYNTGFVSEVLNLSIGNGSNASSGHTLSDQETRPLNWGVLALTCLIIATAVGNILVCLAVCWEKRLQNMTNYFLMSLAIADLLVSLLVMPLGMVVELYGELSETTRLGFQS